VDALNYIDGKHAAAAEWLENIEPATGAAYGRVASSDAADVERAVAAGQPRQQPFDDARVRLGGEARLVPGVEGRISVLAQQRVGVGTCALSRVDRLLDGEPALVERLGDARIGELAQQDDRDAERDERPDHHAGARLDEEVAARRDHRRRDAPERRHLSRRGRTRSVRR
jgi:hypothetical protein